VKHRDTADAMLQAGELAMKLGEVMRVTYHPNGIMRESDTTHTVMLAIIAPALAAQFAPHLDRGLITEMAIFHDLPEAHVGDTDSFAAGPEEMKQKMLRESVAAHRIERQFQGILPYITVRLRQYREQRSPEARWVWAVDKMMPALTHILNGGTYLRQAGATVEDVARFNARETARMTDKCGADLPVLLDLFATMKGMLFEYVYREVPA
jgi:5'-deoxynucleotidase YfbR-like HD superfamily hydrolase